MKRSKINPISAKQRIINAEWAKVKRERIKYLADKYGYFICEWSGEAGNLDDIESLYYLDAHHIDSNRRNNTPENCYIVKRIYHTMFKQNHTQVKQEDFQGAKKEG